MVGNPNHPVVREMEQQWYKIAALLMFKFGVTEINITVEDIENIGNRAIGVDTRGGKLKVMLMEESVAEQFAREAGGLAI